ncbi:LptF/LptG family permease [Leptospira sp. GIMC2001]|uniref:LptF/LptG family permease n=1 Tax=Leptospira sp. GIMC2001 TaxID=1513297 RepID=UPI0023496965|nr:LptF/LptG family permease [Leptospira sp. GIMC2001]WCL48051.1 LptF/LptG family permease [Leptospira sp. GIMC2001]
MSQDLRTVRLKNVSDLPIDFQVHTDRGGILKKIKPPILDLYIFLEILSPFLVALSFFTMIYMAVAIQKMIGLFIGKGIDFFRLLDYLGYILGNTLPMTIPMACLMSGIMAAGRLSGDSEITAMRSAGISFPRIYLNFLFFGFMMACIVGYLNFYLAPENTRKMKEFNNWIMTYNPLLAISPGQFSGDESQDFFEKRGRTMYSGGIDEDTGLITGIQIREWEISAEGNDFISFNDLLIPMGGSRVVQIINAKSGVLVEKLNSKGEFEKAIRLKEGFIIEWDEDKEHFTLTNFINGEMDYNVPTKEQKPTLQINVKPDTYSMSMLFKIRDSIESEGLENLPGLEILKEYNISIKGVGGLKQMVEQMKMEIIMASTNGSMSSTELTQQVTMFTQLTELLTESKKTLTSFNVEIHKRIATPVSCQIFFFLSFPLGLVVKRSGKGMSFTLAVVFLLIYYLFFIFGSGISYKESIPDWIGPWSANFVIMIISIYIMVTRTDAKLPPRLQLLVDKYYDKRDAIVLKFDKWFSGIKKKSFYKRFSKKK